MQSTFVISHSPLSKALLCLLTGPRSKRQNIFHVFQVINTQTAAGYCIRHNVPFLDELSYIFLHKNLPSCL